MVTCFLSLPKSQKRAYPIKIIGGCSKNTMAFADFGTPQKRHSTLVQALSFRSRNQSSITCPPIYFWMEKYGGCSSSLYAIIYLIHRHQRFGRSNFQEAAKLMHRNNHSFIDWSKFKFMVYDAPDQQKLRYQERYAILGTRLLFAFSH